MLDEILQEILPPRRNREAKRGVKRKLSKYPVRRRKDKSRTVPAATLEILR